LRFRTSGPFPGEQAMRRFVAAHFRNLEFIASEPWTREHEGVLYPVPARYVEFGIKREALREE